MNSIEITSPDESDKAAALINAALASTPHIVSHATARLIAAALHTDTRSALAHFAATGQFDLDVLTREVLNLGPTTKHEPWRRGLLTFLMSVRARTHPWARPAVTSRPALSAETAIEGVPEPGVARDATRPIDEIGVKLRNDGEASIDRFAARDATSRSGESADQALVLTITEAAERLRVSQWTVYRLIREGKLRTLQIGTRRLIPLFTLHQFLRTQTAEEDQAHE